MCMKTLGEVAELLQKRYNHGHPDGRKLNVALGSNGYNMPVYFFTLQGSPPKGYDTHQREQHCGFMTHGARGLLYLKISESPTWKSQNQRGHAMPANSSRLVCPKDRTIYCVAATGCSSGQEIVLPDLCQLNKSQPGPMDIRKEASLKAARTMLKRRLAITHETKPHAHVTLSKAEWIKVMRSKKEV